MKTTMDEHIEEMSGFGKLTLFASLIPLSILNGYIGSMIWLWFFVPYGLPDIGVAVMMGMMGFVSFVTHNPSMATKKVESAANWVVERYAYSGLVILTAWIITNFI